MNILFVCKGNKFRSKLAEAYFKKINKNKKIRASSAGADTAIPTYKNKKMTPITYQTIEEFGIKINARSRYLTKELAQKQDKIIIVADNVSNLAVPRNERKKITRWEIRDAKKGNVVQIRRATKQVMRKVEQLIKRLEKNQ